MNKMLIFPEYRQSDKFDCGACALQSVLAYYGIDVNEAEVMKVAGTNQTGTTPTGLETTVEHFGLRHESGKLTQDKLKNFLDQDVPVILAIQAWSDQSIGDWARNWINGHYVVAIGYDEKKIYFEDPSCNRRTFLTFEQLERHWHDVDSVGKIYDHWGMAVFGVPTYNPEEVVPLGY